MFIKLATVHRIMFVSIKNTSTHQWLICKTLVDRITNSWTIVNGIELLTWIIHFGLSLQTIHLTIFFVLMKSIALLNNPSVLDGTRASMCGWSLVHLYLIP